jgi:hypothetical protein
VIVLFNFFCVLDVLKTRPERRKNTAENYSPKSNILYKDEGLLVSCVPLHNKLHTGAIMLTGPREEVERSALVAVFTVACSVSACIFIIELMNVPLLTEDTP